MLEQIEAEMKKSAVNQTSLQAMERKFAAYEEVIAKMCMEAREAKFVGNEELLVRMSSNIEALKSENAALKLLHVHNKFGGLRLTVAGSVCSVLGIGLALLWRLQDQAAKIKDLERQLENEDLYEERHDELVAQNNAILHHQRKPWYHWMVWNWAHHWWILRETIYLWIKQLDHIDEPFTNEENSRDREDQKHHQADRDNITLFDPFDTNQPERHLFNRFESVALLLVLILTQIERYLKKATVDKNPVVDSAALVSGIYLLQTNPEIVKRWSNEVQEAVQSRAALVQIHALALLHQIRQNDRLAVSKLVTCLTRGTVRSPLAKCLLIRYTSQVIRESGISQTGDRPFYEYFGCYKIFFCSYSKQGCNDTPNGGYKLQHRYGELNFGLEQKHCYASHNYTFENRE
ncbi:hypothetical protein MKW92_028995 [Papaver armeniacum]|nr:hypothetical protein MKW92_028995 [Papaver armeniacum]